MAAKPERALRMRKALNTSGRRETAMAEAAAGPGGSSGPADAPSPRGSAGPQEDERCVGGPNLESGGAAPDPDPEATLKPPGKTTTPSSWVKKRKTTRSSSKEPNSFTLSPLLASPEGDKRRSWRRSSLQGRRGRRKSLPPVHRDVSELSQSISLELPEIQRLSLLLLSSFQFSAHKLQQQFQASEGFDPEAFAAKAQAGSEQFQRLLQRLLQDGSLGECLQPLPGDSLDPALEASVAQVKQLMGSLSEELEAWDRLLQQQQQRSQEASRAVSGLFSGSPPRSPPQGVNYGVNEAPRPNYGEILAQHRPLLATLRLQVDEAQQAGKMVLEFHRESRNFLRGLSEQLASRTFRKQPGSPVRKLLEQKPQKALPAEGEQ